MKKLLDAYLQNEHLEILTEDDKIRRDLKNCTVYTANEKRVYSFSDSYVKGLLCKDSLRTRPFGHVDSLWMNLI